MNNKQLPPLPDPHIGLPWRHNAPDGSIHSSAFTAEQMREYALQAIAHAAQPAEVTRNEVMQAAKEATAPEWQDVVDGWHMGLDLMAFARAILALRPVQVQQPSFEMPDLEASYKAADALYEIGYRHSGRHDFDPRGNAEWQRVVDMISASHAQQPKPKPMTEWQPIETAPKDGTEVLLYWGRCRIGKFSPDPVVSSSYHPGVNWYTQNAYGRPNPTTQPTYWMPLPPPPAHHGITAQAKKETP